MSLFLTDPKCVLSKTMWHASYMFVNPWKNIYAYSLEANFHVRDMSTFKEILGEKMRNRVLCYKQDWSGV